MEKRYIGIDFDGSCVRVAIMAQDREGVIALGERPWSTPEELAAALREIIGEARLFGDRIAVAVPAVETFVRWLRFPFTDPRKIEAALGFELSSQIPVPIEQLTNDFQTPLPEEGGGARTAAAAVRTGYLEDLILRFDEADIPVHIIDVAPFAFARGVREQLRDGLLATLGERETTLALVRDGRVADLRLIPGTVSGENAAGILLRESSALLRDSGLRNLPMLLIGPGATGELAEELGRAGRKARIPGFTYEGREVGAEFLPAVALALRAAVPAKEREFNFRRGKYALKNEWTALKREIIAASIVLLLTAMTLAGAAWLNYEHTSNRLEALDRELQTAFRETFPGATPAVDLPLQMQSRINELRQRARLIGSGPQGSSLAVLNEISRSMPPDVTIDVRDLSFTADAVRLEGVTTSFDAINQIARKLQESTLFVEAQITDAKASIDGTRIDFRLNLTFQKG